MQLRFTLRTSPPGDTRAVDDLQSFIDAKRIPSLAELTRFIQCEDESVAVCFVDNARWTGKFAQWALWDRAIADAERDGDTWTPLLDRAAHALDAARSDTPTASPEGNPAPRERAAVLTEWARTATQEELERALGAFKSQTAADAITAGVRNVSREFVEYWSGKSGAYLGMAANSAIAGEPELAAPLAEWACEEILSQTDYEYEAACALQLLLDNGWDMGSKISAELMEMIGESGLIDHEDPDDDSVENTCFPAASVMVHPRVKHAADAWNRLISEIPISALDELDALLRRPDAPTDAFASFLSQTKGMEGMVSIVRLYDQLADHPSLEKDPALRALFMQRAGAGARKTLVPFLTAKEYWAELDRSSLLEYEIVGWLEAALPVHRAGLTQERLSALLTHDSARIRLIAQTFVVDLAGERDQMAPSAPDVASRGSGRRTAYANGKAVRRTRGPSLR